jgi:hypothetical protein
MSEGEEEIVDPAVLAAVEQLWRIPAPGPSNLLSDPAFVALAEVLAARRNGEKPAFALSNGLRNVGLPCVQARDRHLALVPPTTAAAWLDSGFSITTTRQRHLCPLDLADEMPGLVFGAARIGRHSPAELEALFDRERLERFFPQRLPDFRRLAEVQWLILEEEVPIDPRPEARAIPILFTRMDRDFGAFDPLARRYPAAVERVLFFLLMAPWEDWSTMLEVDWRGFKLPWIYTVDPDIAVQPMAPPDDARLSFEPAFAQDEWGENVEYERPLILRQDDAFGDVLKAFVGSHWDAFAPAMASELFQTPVEHFLVRAFATDGIDQILAHMTALEAALGEEADHFQRLRPKGERGPSATDRLAWRIAGLLDDASASMDYRQLFKIRSLFVHGRLGLSEISTDQRVTARRLARRVVAGIYDLAATGPVSRSDLLSQLLARGAAISA